MLDFFQTNLKTLDPAVADLIGYEAERQARKLIMIPSESQAPEAVREALGSVFQNIYAEGYPDPDTHKLTEPQILDYEVQLAAYRRDADERYYKGVEYADVLESLARRRAAEAFAANGVPPEEIWANVQPLSGSPANSAVYAALVPIGATVMGMDLLHGGHLTHGSPANRSGKLYNIVSYGIDPATERLNYDAIEALAKQHKPKMIIAGFTSYPWMPDWARFRQIADAAGAYLLADISHIAGMVAAGVVPSPIGHAHVISFTTHKTLYGPRGACILTTDRALGQKVDSAVFPGEQGGPHMNTIAGMAVAFKLARTPEFARLQRQVVENAKHLAAELERHGLRVPYGGTDTHMILVDCKSVRAERGVSPDGKRGTPLMGDTAVRILDIAGIVCNRNTIPGDKRARTPSGIRLGTPWITQRGFEAPQIERLAEIIARVLKATKPHAYMGRHGPVYFAKVDYDVLEDAKRDVVDLACCVDLGADYVPAGYPHHYFMHKQTTDLGGEYDIIEIAGPHARGFCNVAMSNDVYALGPGESQPTWVLNPDGSPICGGVLKRTGPASTTFQLLVPKPAEARVAHWFRALSDGYVDVDPTDVHAKAPGPVVVRRLPHELADAWPEKSPAAEDFECDCVGWAFHKPYWIGRGARATAPGGLTALPAFEWVGNLADCGTAEPAGQPLKRTNLYEVHRRSGAKIVPFAGYEMPVQYSSVIDEHRAVRQAAGLFDVSHMGLFEFSGENVHLFLNTLTTNDVALIKVGGSQYSYLLGADGGVIDDIWIYRIEPERYWVVVNASNNDKDWAWVNAVREHRVAIDAQRPWSRALGAETVLIRDMRDPARGSEMRAQLALQGPRSRDILLALLDSPPVATGGAGGGPLAEQLLAMARNDIIHGWLAGYDLYIGRTGYTGEPMAFEIFVHPAAAPALWHALLDAGAAFSLQPIGLAARDSLRIEAGLPLYGHELAGPLGLNPADAGFAPYVKLYKPFFIGKAAYVAHELVRNARLARFRVDEEHVAMVGQGDVIVNRKGKVVGAVTSCSIDTEGRLNGLAYVQEPNHLRDTRLGVYRLGSRNWGSQSLENLKPGDRLELPEDITVIERFLNKK
ncbi:MAG: glycine cleavage system aminomethyltransferase GcvT [Chloroflexi bacterium]|nr:glycine cleavage system aminomethyltransferase GcvT [Chloroflexota bacterium]